MYHYIIFTDLTKNSKDMTSRWFAKCNQSENIMSKAEWFARNNKTDIKDIAINVVGRKKDWEKQWGLWAEQLDMSSAPKF